MAQIRIQAVPLTREAFALFGDVVQIEGAGEHDINAGKIQRFHDLADVVVDTENGGRPVVSIAYAQITTSMPVSIPMVERHPLGSQAFIPFSELPMVVVVAEQTDEPVNPYDLKAFVSNGKQGINYKPGVWHMPLIAFEEGQQWLIIDREGPGENCDQFCFENDEIEVYV